MSGMLIFYMVGYVILFIAILAVGSYAWANDEENEKDIIALLASLIVFPFFSWLLILVTAYFSDCCNDVFIYIKESKDVN